MGSYVNLYSLWPLVLVLFNFCNYFSILFFHSTLDVILETPFHFFSNYAPLVLPKYDVKLNIKTFTDSMDYLLLAILSSNSGACTEQICLIA